MSSSDEERGPKFVWSFPLVTRMQTRGGLIGLGLKTIMQRRANKQVEETDEEDTEDSDPLDSIQSSIEELESNSPGTDLPEDSDNVNDSTISQEDVDTEPTYEQKRTMSQAVDDKEDMDAGFSNDS